MSESQLESEFKTAVESESESESEKNARLRKKYKNIGKSAALLCSQITTVTIKWQIIHSYIRHRKVI